MHARYNRLALCGMIVGCSLITLINVDIVHAGTQIKGFIQLASSDRALGLDDAVDSVDTVVPADSKTLTINTDTLRAKKPHATLTKIGNWFKNKLGDPVLYYIPTSINTYDTERSEIGAQKINKQFIGGNGELIKNCGGYLTKMVKDKTFGEKCAVMQCESDNMAYKDKIMADQEHCCYNAIITKDEVATIDTNLKKLSPAELAANIKADNLCAYYESHISGTPIAKGAFVSGGSNSALDTTNTTNTTTAATAATTEDSVLPSVDSGSIAPMSGKTPEETAACLNFAAKLLQQVSSDSIAQPTADTAATPAAPAAPAALPAAVLPAAPAPAAQ